MTTLRIVHTTTFDYEKSITSSYNEARLLPAWLPRQRVLESRVDVEHATFRTTYRDYWDTEVVAFEVLKPHTSLTVVGSSLVEVLDAGEPSHRADWDTLHGPMLQDLLAEYLVNSPTTEPTAELADFTAAAAARLDPESTAREVCSYLFEQMMYVPGSTNVHTAAAQAWDAKSGVCQDFAHLAIGAMRSVGIPARYVSGYLHPNAEAGVGEAVAGESHAWVEWWAGDWTGFDPTNDREVGNRHVIVARARQYGDVQPVSGVFAGAGTGLTVNVRITQTA